jgi:hypothetical protein
LRRLSQSFRTASADTAPTESPGKGRFPPMADLPCAAVEGRLWGTKMSSRGRGRATAVGSEKRPSLGRAPTGKTRRKRSHDHASGSRSIRPKSERVSPSKGPESGRLKLPQPLRSDTQAGPTRRCPPDGYDVSWMRVSQRNERWRTWEGSTARLPR